MERQIHRQFTALSQNRGKLSLHDEREHNRREGQKDLPDKEIAVLEKYRTEKGLLFTVRDHNRYRVGQTVQHNGIRYRVIEIITNASLNLTGLRVIRAT